jgi:murein DD-endopeptidase MepM/ murein hydrolase activator NlpD
MTNRRVEPSPSGGLLGAWALFIALLLAQGCAARHVSSSEPWLEAMQVVVPKAGHLCSDFDDQRTHGLHRAVDVCAKQGVRVWAAESGVVKGRGRHRTAGRWVDIDHGNGRVTRYLHLSCIKVKKGQQVRGGRTIGRLGHSGNAHRKWPHLHFELVENGVKKDPLPYLQALSHVKRRKR